MVSQSNSVGYTIMGKTADLTVIQKTTIDTLHKEGKTQKVIAKEAGCSQSSVSKHINRILHESGKQNKLHCKLGLCDMDKKYISRFFLFIFLFRF